MSGYGKTPLAQPPCSPFTASPAGETGPALVGDGVRG